jgi:hypothetical protein
MASSHEVLGEYHPSVEVEVEAHVPCSAARDAALPSASVSIGVVIGGAVVVVRHFVGSLVIIFGRLDWVCRWVVGVVRFVRMFVVRLVYIILVVLCETVCVRHRSRVVWQPGAVGNWIGVFSMVCRYVGWGRSCFSGTYSRLAVLFLFNLNSW